MNVSPIFSSPVMSYDLTRLLATETLSHVFVLSILTPEISGDIRDLPLTISWVCRRWRHTALNTPMLWTNIIVGGPYLSSASIYRTQTWLSRSHNRTLRIYMDLRDPDWDWNEATHTFNGDDMNQMLSLLVPHISRWKSVDILSDTWVPIHNLLLYTRSLAALSLRRIALSRCNAYLASRGQRFIPEDFKTPIALLTGGTPQLRYISLSGVHVDWPRFLHENLVGLQLKYHAQNVMPTMTELTCLLNACDKLECLSIMGWGVRSLTTSMGFARGVNADPSRVDHHRNRGEIIRLPRLRKLEFGWLDASYAYTLFSLLSLPNLVALTLENISASLDFDVPQDDSPILMSIGPASSESCTSRKGEILFGNLQELGLHFVRTTGGKVLYERALSTCHSITRLDVHSPETDLLQVLTMRHTPYYPSDKGAQNDSRLPTQRMYCQKLTSIMFSEVDPSCINQIYEFRSRVEFPVSVHIVCDDTSEGTGDTS